MILATSFDTVYCSDRVENEYSALHEPSTPCTGLHTIRYLLARLLRHFAFQSLFHQVFRQVHFESLWNHAQLRQLLERFDSRNDRYIDTCRLRLLHKFKIFPVIVEQLCHGIFRPVLHFFLQPVKVSLDIRRFFVLLRITSHPV